MVCMSVCLYVCDHQEKRNKQQNVNVCFKPIIDASLLDCMSSVTERKPEQMFSSPSSVVKFCVIQCETSLFDTKTRC